MHSINTVVAQLNEPWALAPTGHAGCYCYSVQAVLSCSFRILCVFTFASLFPCSRLFHLMRRKIPFRKLGVKGFYQQGWHQTLTEIANKFKIVETYWHDHSLESSCRALSDCTIRFSIKPFSGKCIFWIFLQKPQSLKNHCPMLWFWNKTLKMGYLFSCSYKSWTVLACCLFHSKQCSVHSCYWSQCIKKSNDS
jgi:hypothetical protein